MEILKVRRDAVEKALGQLKSSLDDVNKEEFEKIYDKLRDSVIQRFEFCVDTFWKFFREYLEWKTKIVIKPVSPRPVFREAAAAGFINVEELKLFMEIIEDRNLTSHTYNEELAEEISQRIAKHHEMMIIILNRCEL